jgi:hypothetical protein
MTTAAWMGAATAAIGALLTFAVVAIALRQRHRERTGLHATGTVVDMVVIESTGKRRSSRYHFPVFEFVTETGRTLRHQSSAGSDPPTHQIGDQIDIWYHPNDPQQCDIRGESRALLIAFAAVGLLFLAVGIGVVVMARSSVMAP